jgi:carboxylesterase type B
MEVTVTFPARARRSAVVAALALAASGLAPAATSVASTRPPLAVTDTGVVRGASAHGVESFLGIPYAAPPVGDLRFATPRPAQRWHGVRDATAYGNRCPAVASSNGPRSETEDCLFVNVQRPARARPGAKLPVLVFIHGGGLNNGSSTQHDMAKIVRETGVVGVTMNYRLGVFGFLGLPGLTGEAGDSGNYGFADQQAALRWVRRNVGAFGGDPRRVTIDGESAGGWSVCGHLAAPGSRGLFAGAMIQSGSCASRPLAGTEAAGTTYAAAAGCADAATAAECLRALPAGRLLDAAPFQPQLTSGGRTLPVAPGEAVRTGRFARVPVVNGATLDEGRTFLQGLIGQDRAQYEGFVRSLFGADADAVLAQYPWPASGADRFTAAYLGSAVFTDSGFLAGIGGCGTRQLSQTFARYTRTYQYEFAHRTGPGLTPIPGYEWGAGHAAELAYLWPSFDNGTPIAPTFGAAERRLAREMVQYWGAFTKRGSPSVAGQTPWPSYGRTGLTLSLRAGGRSTLLSDAAYAAEHKCAFWESIRPPAV